VSEGLAEAVETVLEQADWFANKVDEKLDELVDDHDFTYEVEQAVESEVSNYFGHDFSLEDHCDVYDLMRDAVDDKLEDMVQEKVEEILQEKLQNITITFN
jgi:vacuolar-type H+-ATPase subunit E/Vma4